MGRASRAVAALALLFVAAGAGGGPVPTAAAGDARPDVATVTGAAPAFNCLVPPSLTPTVPKDMLRPSQGEVNCFAWQQFVALNWPADPATCAADPEAGPADFGTPGDSRPVVWATYKRAGEVFLPGAATPAPWCAPRDKPVVLSEIAEAAPEGAWLTAQTGTLTLFEMLMNRDEFAYVADNGLYDAAKQLERVLGEGLSLPDGTTGGSDQVGAIELKAAWLEITPPLDPSEFLTTEVVVDYPDQEARTATVGLVGLHIIHKTRLAQQFVWATFEHVRNAPDADALPTSGDYLYFDPSCDPSTHHYRCALNEAPTPGQDPYGAPVQVARVDPVPSTTTNDVVGLNEAMWDRIGQANPDSVFLNYQLVNALWPNANTVVEPGARVPLPDGNPEPKAEVVANTTMETYRQQLNCLDCHTQASISTGVPGAVDRMFAAVEADDDAPYASDYSFLFGRAYASAATAPAAQGSARWLRAVAVPGVVLLAFALALLLRRRRPS